MDETPYDSEPPESGDPDRAADSTPPVLLFVGLGVLLLLGLWLFMAGPRSSRRSPADPTVAAAETTPVSDGGFDADIFHALRATPGNTPLSDASWNELAEALSHLDTLDGASVDPETGQLLLSGRPTDGRGPFTIDDIVVALRAAFYEKTAVAMSIDEDPNDKEGPWMLPRFEAGTARTRLGWVMFECDRLMKSLGLEKDNITKAALVPRVKGFESQIAISKRMGGSTTPVWNRYWLNINTKRFADSDLRGKTLLDVAKGRPTIAFERHQVYVDTDRMVDPGKGAKLASLAREDPQARAYADGFVDHYDELAKEFPVFRHLHELSKLVVLAEWIRDNDVAIDPEIFFLDLRDVPTPEKTPSVSTTTEWTVGSVGHKLMMLGGVNLAPNIKYVEGRGRPADALAEAVEKNEADLRAGRAVQWSGPDRVIRQLVPIGPTRGPPTTSSARVRRRLGRPESTGKVTPTSRPLEAVFGGRQLSIWTDAKNGQEMLNFPVVRQVDFTRRVNQVVYNKTETVDIPAALSITSPLRDINVRFSVKPAYDEVEKAPYFAGLTSENTRYFPLTRTLRVDDGSTYHFDGSGILTEYHGIDGPRLQFTHTDYQDGPLTLSFASIGPRGPPSSPRRRIESTGIVQPTSRPARHVIRNLSNPGSASITSPKGTYIVDLQ